MIRIALDAMGGDFAPGPNIEGAVAALEANPDVEIVLVGDAAVLDPLLKQTGYSGARLRIEQADSFIGMDEKPVEALRKKPNNTIAVCWRLMARRDVDAVVSAGHTGAVVAAGLTTRLYLKGVKRPGIAVAVPTLKGRAVLMDCGANPAAKPEHLMQYGIMGLIYAREILGIEKPTVGLMNIGGEEGKGNELVLETHKFFASSQIRDHYVGNVEGRGLYQHDADVVICEGFVGNVVLKASEGMADMILRTVQHELGRGAAAGSAPVAEALDLLNKRYQYHESGGAPLLGIDGTCIICHGSSNGRSIFNALRVARELQNRKINEQIVEAFSRESFGWFG